MHIIIIRRVTQRVGREKQRNSLKLQSPASPTPPLLAMMIIVDGHLCSSSQVLTRLLCSVQGKPSMPCQERKLNSTNSSFLIANMKDRIMTKKTIYLLPIASPLSRPRVASPLLQPARQLSSDAMMTNGNRMGTRRCGRGHRRRHATVTVILSPVQVIGYFIKCTSDDILHP